MAITAVSSCLEIYCSNNKYIALNDYYWLWPWVLPVKTEIVVEKYKLARKPESSRREKEGQGSPRSIVRAVKKSPKQ